jgi:hypothetical protein
MAIVTIGYEERTEWGRRDRLASNVDHLRGPEAGIERESVL